MSVPDSTLSAPNAETEYRRRRLIILGSVLTVCTIVTICFCTWMGVLVSRARAQDAAPNGTPTANAANTPGQTTMCP